LLGGLISCLYIYVSIQGTPVRGVWRRGVVLGAGLGITWLVIGVCSILIETSALGLVLDAGLLIMPVLAGALGARQTGRFGSGSLAGFWCGIAAAALIALSIVVIDIAFAPHLLQTNWAHDSHCDLHRGDALAACEISDDLGYAASILVILPVIMAGLGMIGGAIGTMTERRRVAKESPVVDNSRAPFIFSLLMVVLFATELLLNLW
jgi:hypothetical protein